MDEQTAFGELRDMRLRLVEVTRENGFEEGLRSLLSELYPDNAHFIYELLQNAEDACATVVEFELTDHALTVSHDGAKAFSLEDIQSITSIGTSTKRGDETQIGKFGVGFKAVFAYTTRPEIYSERFSFAIANLFVPELTSGAGQPGRTVFRFPFDRAEKPSDTARAEVERGLRQLDEKSLLFLNSIREITYTLPNGDIGWVKRTDTDEVTIHVEAAQGSQLTESAWLRLVGPASAATDTNPLTVAAAFKLERREAGRGRQGAHAAAPQEAALGVAALESGDVSIYFPAAKERSRLRFHIHAPFASTVARDSVRDTPENAQLIADVGDLIAQNLPRCRDRGLIDDGFLAALPNADDDLQGFYEQIRHAIAGAFNAEALTPVRRGGYGAARRLVSSPSEFRAGLSQSDLPYLLELTGQETESEPKWIAERDGRAGRFLHDLDSIVFGWDELDAALTAVVPYWPSDEPDSELKAWHRWLEAKDDNTLLNLYELLGQGAGSELATDLAELPVVRLRQRGHLKHVTGRATFLPPNRSSENQARVPAELAYFEDEETKRSINLRLFYRAVGVKRWDERARTEARLAPYRAENFPDVDSGDVPPAHFADMSAFVAFGLSDTKATRSVFSNVHFILVTNRDGELAWARPAEIYIDEPFRSTGLAAMYGDDATRYPLSALYLSVPGIAGFLAAAGASCEIEIVRSSPAQNPKFDRSWSAGKNENINTVRLDWDIRNFDRLIATREPALLLSLWRAVCSAPEDRSEGVYRANASYPIHRFQSLAAQRLTATEWIPVGGGKLERPSNLSVEQLPADWPKPVPGTLAAGLPFGAHAAREDQRAAMKPHYASSLGIELEEADLIVKARAAGIDVTEALQELIAQSRIQAAFPGMASGDPDRRSAVAAFDAISATIHETDVRLRSVVVGRAQSSEDTKAYLRGQYTNAEGQMFCQACHNAMPFRIKNTWYFETVQFIGLRQRVHRQNWLAMCPLCAALYRYKRESTDRALLDALSALSVEQGRGSVDMEVLVNNRTRRIRFTGQHAIDLRSALGVSGQQRDTT